MEAYDVVVAGGGTAGVVAALAAARAGARTALVEQKGYVGGIAVEGGTTLHSFFNLWQGFPGVKKRQLVGGIPDEIVARLRGEGGSPGHCDQLLHVAYDSACTNVDTESYKNVAMKMLREAGARLYLNTLVTDAAREGDSVTGVVTEHHEGARFLAGKMFIDATGFGDLSARAHAPHVELNDHGVTNSMGVAGVDIEEYFDYLLAHDALFELARGERDGKPGRIIRIAPDFSKLGPAIRDAFREIDMAGTMTTTHDGYIMFVKVSVKTDGPPHYEKTLTDAEHVLRERQQEAIRRARKLLPGFQNAFIARTSPTLTIRRARCVACEYDIPIAEIVEGRHYEDDVLSYGFHDSAPRIQIKNGGSYGIPYRALVAKELKNLFAIGMLISTDHEAHMSTRNTVSCMAQGQAAGTAAALCALAGTADAADAADARSLPYPALRQRLEKDGVIFDTNSAECAKNG